MPQQASDQLPGPRGREWEAADAMLDGWIATLNANADMIVATVTQYTEWVADAVRTMEATAVRLTAEQAARIQSGVDAILASFPTESWHRANLRAQECLAPYPPLRRLLTFERTRRILDRFGPGAQGAVNAVVAQGALGGDEQRHVELLTRPWRSAGLAMPAPPPVPLP